jgi:hypothetical protein
LLSKGVEVGDRVKAIPFQPEHHIFLKRRSKILEERRREYGYQK